MESAIVPMESEGKFISKEEFERQTAGSLINREPHELTLISESDDASMAWEMILKDFKTSGIPIRGNVHEKTKYWKKRSYRYVALISGIESKDVQCIALISRKTAKTPFFVNLIITMAPVMTQPFVCMMIETLENIAKDYNTTLIVPKQYRNVINNIYDIESDTGVDAEIND